MKRSPETGSYPDAYQESISQERTPQKPGISRRAFLKILIVGGAGSVLLTADGVRRIEEGKKGHGKGKFGLVRGEEKPFIKGVVVGANIGGLTPEEEAEVKRIREAVSKEAKVAQEVDNTRLVGVTELTSGGVMLGLTIAVGLIYFRDRRERRDDPDSMG